MALINSKTGKIIRDYSIEELKEQARLMRGYNLVALCAAGSGHGGGTLSIMDITAALYLKTADLDPKNPLWDVRDRIVWSTGHKAPSLYLGLAFAGFYSPDEVVLLRKLWSPYQGHPHWVKLPAVESSTGSLGQGLSGAVGMALAGKLDKKDYRVFCLIGDGESQEGQIWEAAMAAAQELNDENLRTAINAARQVSDVVIAMPHWGPEDNSDPDSNQLDFAQVAVEAGADVVVGNHTHVVQAIEQLNGIDIFYGLGNFIFDQTWDLAHQQGVMLVLHFYGTDYTGYDLIPTHVDGDGTVHIAGPDEARNVLQRIETASEKLR